MGCGPSIEAPSRGSEFGTLVPSNASSSAVEAKPKAKYLESFTILLIGAGDSGKSTLRKQLSHIYGKGFERVEERRSYAALIVGNILDGTLMVLGKMGSVDEKIIEELREEARARDTHLSAKAARTILSLNRDNLDFVETIQTKSREIQLPENYIDYCKRLKAYPAWGGPGWIPTADDCIRARARTTGITKMELFVDQRKYTIIDVGGQRPERKKWLNNKANMRMIDLVIFVSSLSDYDQQLFEENGRNRLEESLDLFSQCINSEWLRDCPVVLYLNKKDIFDRKFKKEKIPLNVSGRFPDAPTGDLETKQAIGWIVSKYAAKRKRKQRMSAFVMSATSRDRVQSVFDQCRDMLIKREFLIGTSPQSTQISEGSASQVSTQSV